MSGMKTGKSVDSLTGCGIELRYVDGGESGEGRGGG